MVELLMFRIIASFIQAQPQAMTASYAVLISLGSVILSGLTHFGVYMWREGKKAKEFENMQAAVKDFAHRLTMMEIRFAAHTGKTNGGNYRNGED